MKTTWSTLAHILEKDGIAIIPTDTLYGIVGKAFSKKAVEKVYHVKGRDKGKPCIVLISSFEDLKKFDINIHTISNGKWEKLLHHVWPDKISIVLPSAQQKWRYLHRGSGGISFRMVSPKNKNLHALLQKVGPLVAPSANPQGEDPARSCAQAKAYFGDAVDAYIDGGIKNVPASTLVSLLGSKPKVLRQGSVDIYSKE